MLKKIPRGINYCYCIESARRRHVQFPSSISKLGSSLANMNVANLHTGGEHRAQSDKMVVGRGLRQRLNSPLHACWVELIVYRERDRKCKAMMQ